MPEISIVVPIYNSVRFIEECIQSILGQTMESLEVILVDAGSTDGTLEILKKYEEKDPRVRRLPSEKKSMGYQYNLGIEHARGNYVGFVESDDCVSPAMYEQLLDAMKTYQLDYVKADFDMFIDLEQRIYLHYNVLGSPSSPLYQKILAPREFLGLIGTDCNMWNGLYSLDFIRRNRIRLNETPGAAFQDTGFVLQSFCCAKHVMYVKGNSYRYRRDNDSSSVYSSRVLEFILQEFRYIGKFLKERNMEQTPFSIEIQKKFLGMLGGTAGKIAFYRALSVRDYEVFREFRKEFLGFHADVPYGVISQSGMDSMPMYHILLSDSLFRMEWPGLLSVHMHQMETFWQHARRYGSIAVFGAGKQGCCCCAFLLRNGYKGEILFFDNDEKKWGTCLMGVEVKNPKHVMEYCSDALFIVANNAHFEEIRLQLLKLGIAGQSICRSVSLGPHVAFEAVFENQENQCCNRREKNP